MLLCALLCTACGSSSGGSNNASPGLSGNWQMSLLRSSTNIAKSASGFLIQSGKSVTGSILVSAGADNCAGVGPVSGQVSAGNITLSVGQVGRTVNLAGTVGKASTSMSGNYSILASPCGATQTGTWTGTQVQPVMGNFKGTFSSAIESEQFQLTGQIAQGPNTGSSDATLSGNLTTNHTCFSSASISGLIGGTAVVFNLTSAEGEALGTITGNVTTDGTSITGTYEIDLPFGECYDSGSTTIKIQ